MVATPDDEFKALKAADIVGDKETITVIDCWRLLGKTLQNEDRVTYVPLGRDMELGAAGSVLQDLWGSD